MNIAFYLSFGNPLLFPETESKAQHAGQNRYKEHIVHCHALRSTPWHRDRVELVVVSTLLILVSRELQSRAKCAVTSQAT